MFEPPLAVDGLDAPGGVVGDLAAVVRAEAGVVVSGLVGEVRGDGVGVAGVERLVVGPDVVEVADPGNLPATVDLRATRSS